MTKRRIALQLPTVLVFTALAINLAVARPASAGVTYDLAADWSDTVNPNGPWS